MNDHEIDLYLTIKSGINSGVNIPLEEVKWIEVNSRDLGRTHRIPFEVGESELSMERLEALIIDAYATGKRIAKNELQSEMRSLLGVN